MLSPEAGSHPASRMFLWCMRDYLRGSRALLRVLGFCLELLENVAEFNRLWPFIGQFSFFELAVSLFAAALGRAVVPQLFMETNAGVWVGCSKVDVFALAGAIVACWKAGGIVGNAAVLFVVDLLVQLRRLEDLGETIYSSSQERTHCVAAAWGILAQIAQRFCIVGALSPNTAHGFESEIETVGSRVVFIIDYGSIVRVLMTGVLFYALKNLDVSRIKASLYVCSLEIASAALHALSGYSMWDVYAEAASRFLAKVQELRANA